MTWHFRAAVFSVSWGEWWWLINSCLIWFQTLFNPNKTVVKMFVVLFDFSDMPPRSQTFLRQRTFSVWRHTCQSTEVRTAFALLWYVHCKEGLGGNGHVLVTGTFWSGNHHFELIICLFVSTLLLTRDSHPWSDSSLYFFDSLLWSCNTHSEVAIAISKVTMDRSKCDWCIFGVFLNLRHWVLAYL